ncbi:CAPN2 [Symbiodinium natans]|uniref:CAPN2 protein n=1 Tax=Symbiodinium natans TaxID=878477 RepID=A0A812RZ47_9DINO|nr:CAPN2 [Symbiodinium natans]
MSVELARRIQNAFDNVDLDGNGLISKEEIHQLFLSLGGSELDDLVSSMDTNKDGKISAEEFVSWILNQEKASETSVRINMGQLMERTASACLVKPEFVTPDVPQYDLRCLPDDDSWLKLRQKLQDDKEVFQDKVFGPTDDSLFGGSAVELGDKAAGKRPFKVDHWARIWDMAKEGCNGPLIKDGACAHDIQQGNLGDCYFLSAVAAVSQSDVLVARLLPGSQTINQEGIYAVRFWQDGAWRIVVVDDQLPCRGKDQPIFAAARNGDFWVAVVEKAFAKLNGSYRAISSGSQPDALFCLTGILMPRTLKLRPYRADPSDKQELFNLMCECASTGGLLGCASKGKWEMGIAPLHAYTILGLCQIRAGGGIERLVHVRNPWGSGKEWQGRFSDGDAAWSEVSAKDKERLGGARSHKDGTWYMNFDDFCEHFFCAYFGLLFPAATHSLYHVATEHVAGKKPATVVVKAASSGSVRVLFGGPTSRALPDSAERAAVCLLCEKSRGDRVERIKARTRSSTDCTFTVGKGDILAFKFTAEPSSRIYLSIVCPCDSEVTVDHGDGEVELSAPPTMEKDEDPDEEAMLQIVRKAADLTGWSNEDQRAVAEKLQSADICTPHAFLTLVLSGNINARLPKNKGFGKRSSRHLFRVAEELAELEGVVASVAKQTGWGAEDQTKVVRKFVLAGLCSCEELADALLDGSVNHRLVDVGQQPFGRQSATALQAWAKRWSAMSSPAVGQ